MAKSNAHKWGQKMGEVLEAAVVQLMTDFARDHHVFLDKHGRRAARRGRKVAWLDVYGNTHNLDYVLEKGGTENVIGAPCAFIEAAWRSYTKHSRNKAQEIQGAILPLVLTHRNSAPFIGAILAGVFTEGALKQLRSLGFVILFFPYAGFVQAFERVGIDVRFDEATDEDTFRGTLESWGALTAAQKAEVCAAILEIHAAEVVAFTERLAKSIAREIEAVFVLPLHGRETLIASVEQAIAYIEGYNEVVQALPVVNYIIEVRYNTGDRIEGKFASKDAAIDFLRGYLPPPIIPAAG